MYYRCVHSEGDRAAAIATAQRCHRVKKTARSLHRHDKARNACSSTFETAITNVPHSHEIRNPLSSIVHCADEITSCLKDLPELSDDQQSISKASLLSAKEAAETILFCTQHTKRIVDDILTLSKLNSKILRISPVAVEAKSTVTQALKMFEGELRAANIDLELVIDDSLDQLQIEWVQLDTSRILQILVNLIGNR